MNRAVLLVAIALLVAGSLSRPARGADERSFTVAPPPSWVEAVEEPASDGDAGDARDGVLDLLEDSQMRVTATSVDRFYRHVAKVLTAAGLEQVSRIQLDFDPSDESLVIHYIRIRRGAETIDALRPADVTVIQPERELDDQIYSGALSALAFLRDVRPGDVVDYAYSLRSAEGYGGRFADELVLGEPYPVRKIRWRVLWPAGRPVWFRDQNTTVSPATRELGGETEYVWQIDSAPAVDVEEDAPLWFDPTPVVQMSEFQAWGDVVRWALPYYARPAAIAPDLDRQIAAWRAEYERPEDRLLAAARFVQDEIRYTGIELGPSSYVPADPSTVFERRFGDCKDKSALLVTMLGRMEIDASPALVSLDRGRVLPDTQPSPLAFDHCIARASVDGKTYWIDSTIMLQRGDLARRSPPDYSYALVLGDGVTGLEQIGAAGGHAGTDVHEVYTLDGEGARLEVTTTYTGAGADDARLALAQMSLSDLGKDGLDYYGGEFQTIEAEGIPEIADDEGANSVRVTERFRIASFWEDGERSLTAGRVDDVLPSARTGRRSGPLAVEFPVEVSQTIEVRAPAAVDLRAESGMLEDDAVRFAYKFGAEGRTISLEFRYVALSDSVSAALAAEHREIVRKIRKRLDYTVRRDDIRGRLGAVEIALYGAPIAGLGAALAVWLILRRRQRVGAGANPPTPTL